MSARRARWLGAALAGLGLVLVLGVVGVTLLRDGSSDQRYVIPAGTAARVAAGEDVDVLPTRIDLDAGDTLTVVNQDVQEHFLGVKRIPPGTTLTQEFGQPGEFQAVCTVHPKGSLIIDVR